MTLGADTITDSSTTDTDTLNATLNASITNTTTVTKVENINLTALGNITVDMANITGVKQLGSNSSTGTIITTNTSDAAMALSFAGSTTNTITVGYKAGTLSGASDKLVANLSSAKNVTAAADAGFESAEVAISGTGNTITSVTAAGASSMTISGTGDVTISDNAFTSSSAFTITNTAAIKIGDFTTTDLTTLTATANTGGITGKTALATGAIYNTADQIDGATTGLTMMLGSGVDNIFINEQAAVNKTNTIKLGAGNDLLNVTNAGLGATYVFGEDGDDKIQVTAVALETTDLISGGAGTDTLRIVGNLVNNLTLLGVENVELEGTTGALTTVNSSDTATAFNVKVVDNDLVDIAGLTAGSTVAVNVKTAGTATTSEVDEISVKFAAAEAASTIDVNTAVDDAAGTSVTLTTDKITAVTVDFAEKVGESAAGDINVTDGTSLTIIAAKAIVFDDILAGSELLTTLTVTGSNAVTIDDVVNDAVLATVSITATNNIDLGAIADADKVTSLTLTSSAGSVTVDQLGDNGATTTDADSLDTVSLSGATTVTAGIIEADIIGNVTMTATNGLLTVTEITSAAAMGTVSLTSTAGAIKLDTGDIVAADTTGITVNMTAATYIDVTGAAGAKADVTNTKGDIASTLSGAAVATIDFTAGTINDSANSGSVNLTSNVTGGITTTITNNELVGVGSSTITLSALSSSTTNSVTLLGYTASTTINGSIGADTIINSDGGDILATNSTNSSDTYVGGLGTDTLSYAGNTHDANSGTNNAGDTANGYAMNFTGSTITFDNTPVTSATNITTLAAGKVAQYDSTKVSTVSSTAGNIVAGGEIDSVTGFETVIGSDLNDYIAVANTGMTVTGGLGIDKIVFNSGVDTFVATVAAAKLDIVSSFTAGGATTADNVKALDATFSWFGDGAGSDNDGVIALATGATIKAAEVADDNATILTISADAAANTFDDFLAGTTNEAAMEALVITALGLTGAASATDILIVAVDDGEHTAIFKFTGGDAATDDAVDAAEIEIMAILTGVTDATTLAAGDFLFA